MVDNEPPSGQTTVRSVDSASTTDELQQMAELAAGQQSDHQTYVMYLGDTASSIVDEVGEVQRWGERSAIVELDGRIAGWLVADVDEDMGRVWGDAFDEVDRSRPLSEQFAWVFDQVSGHHLRNPGLARVYLKEMVFLSESQRQGTAQFLTMFHDRMTGLMVEAQGRGRLRDDVPLAVLSQNLFAIWLSVIRRSLSVDASRHEVGEMLRRSLAVAMLGLECPG
jgi:hypothetical protein